MPSLKTDRDLAHARAPTGSSMRLASCGLSGNRSHGRAPACGRGGQRWLHNTQTNALPKTHSSRLVPGVTPKPQPWFPDPVGLPGLLFHWMVNLTIGMIRGSGHSDGAVAFFPSLSLIFRPFSLSLILCHRSLLKRGLCDS